MTAYEEPKKYQTHRTGAHPNSRQQIELRAYYIRLTTGGGHGSDLDHWLQAEK